MFLLPLCPPSYLGLHLEGACLSLGSSRSRTWDRKVGSCGLFGRQSQEEGQAGHEKSQLWAPGSILWGRKAGDVGVSTQRLWGWVLTCPFQPHGLGLSPRHLPQGILHPSHVGFSFSFWQHIWATFIKIKKNFNLKSTNKSKSLKFKKELITKYGHHNILRFFFSAIPDAKIQWENYYQTLASCN